MMKPTKKAPAAKAAPKKPASAKVAAKPAPASKTPTREWVALVAAHAKAKAGNSERGSSERGDSEGGEGALPGYKIMALPEGTRLIAVLAEETGDHWRIKDAAIDGKKLPRNIKILEKAEWRLLPGDGEPAAADAEAADVVAEPESLAPPAEPAPAETIPEVQAAAPLKLCLRGAGILEPHLKKQFTVVVEGASTFHNWGIFPVARAVALHDEAASPAGRALLEKLPGIPPGRFVSEINTGGADVYVLSFASEISPMLFRSKSTGMVLPLSVGFMSTPASGKASYAAIADKAAAANVTEQDWAFLQSELEYVGLLNETMLADDLNTMFELLRGKMVIVLMLNTTTGESERLLTLYGRINAVVRPLIESYGLQAIEINDFVRTPDDLVKPDSNGAMFKPRIYAQIAARVMERLTEMTGGHGDAS